MGKPEVAILFGQDKQKAVLDEATVEKLNRTFTVRWGQAADTIGAGEAAELLNSADGCMTCWGSPRLDAELLNRAPRLKILAHAAGTVKPFVSEALWDRRIAVTSASSGLAIDVAHFTLALMIIGRKNLMELSATAGQGEGTRVHGHRPPDELPGCVVGIVGASHIGRLVMSLLERFDVEILLCDPFVDAGGAKKLGARKVELEELFRNADIVSLHAPALPATRHMVTTETLAMMKNGATLINTARGSLVDEAALTEELKRRRIWAFLDVTDPEPPEPGSPLYGSPNLTLSPHIAGPVGRGRKRLGAQAFEELRRFFAGEPLMYPVSREMLERIA